MSITPLQQLRSFRSPGPLTEVFTVPGAEITVKIAGLTKGSDRARIYAEIAEWRTVDTWPIDGKPEPLTDNGKVNACWAAACVQEPAGMTTEDWIVFFIHNPDQLDAIAVRCLIASRIIEDKENAIPTGAEAAEQELAADPFLPVTSRSA